MSSSSDLEAPITQQIIQKKEKKTRTKKKFKPQSSAADPTITIDHGKNEGDDPDWAYKPPAGAVLLDHTVDVSTFDWDAFKDDTDTEIWLIRVPDAIKEKHLDGLEIDPPSSSRTARIGGLTRKAASYDIWSIGEDDADVAVGEELLGLSCLLPRKRTRGLYIAPKPISHHIVISATHSTATPQENGLLVHQYPPRVSYLKDVLKHAFVPYGARSKQTPSEGVSMDVDATEEKPSSVAVPTPSKDKPPKSKGKKRKVEGETPKKSKKHKTES